MILIDRRIGSCHLAPILKKMGHPVEIKTLHFGDARFTGNGPEGRVDIGVELKTLGDLLSCIVDKRLTTHQLPGLVREYDDVWLVIEGQWRANHDGSIDEWKQFSTSSGRWLSVRARLTHREVSAYLVSLATKAGVRVHRTTDGFETASFLATLYAWWQKPWSQHHAHVSFDRSYMWKADHVLFGGPNLVELMAATILPGIGMAKCRDVAKRFRSIREMVEASEKQWRAIPGVGKTIAKKVVEALSGHAR